MDRKLQALLDDLKRDLQNSYETTPSIDEAEKLAAKFLAAQIIVGSALSRVDLDARMRKNGVKAIRAAIYLETVKSSDKKPTEAFIEATVNTNELVEKEQTGFDRAEVDRHELENYLSVLRDGHIYYRGLAKGRFE